MNLRPYQQQIVDATLSGFGQHRRQLIVVPTGGGKTIIFSALAKATLPGRTLILAHRDELIDQAIAKLHAATGIIAAKEKAEWRASLHADVVVASVQTMLSRKERWPQDHFALVVADEAHHAISDSWRSVLDHFVSARVLGVTATPDRGDKRNLGVFFEHIAAEIGLHQLIGDAYLSRISCKSVPLEIDLSEVKSSAGDYDAGGLGNALVPHLPRIAEAIAEHAAFRRTLAFLPLIATSRAFVDACSAAGVSARHVDGESPDRKELLAGFERGDFDLLSNAMLLTEGYDCPAVDCVVVLRPTRSRALYSQMVGRGTRVAPGKRDLLLLDFLWLHEKHNLIRPAHLVASNEEQAEAITEKLKEDGNAGQGELDLVLLDDSVRQERERKLLEELAAKAKRKARVIDPVEFCLSAGIDGVADYEPTMPWESRAVSEPQREYLAKRGIDLDGVKCFGHASRIIDALVARSKLGLATPKQVRILRQAGVKNPEQVTIQNASVFIDKIFAHKPKPTEERQAA